MIIEGDAKKRRQERSLIPCAERKFGQPCHFGTKPRIELDTGNAYAPHVEIWQCVHCGHGVTRPPMEDVSPLYSGRESEDFLARDKNWVQSIKKFVFARLARALLTHSNDSPNIIADFGTGNGMLAISLAKEVSGSALVYGLDFFDEPPKHMSPAYYSSFARSGFLEGKVDLLVCFHVLEHDDNPDRMLERLLSYLRPGGTLIVEVPNINCIWTPWFRRACANWYAPYHRVHFSKASLIGLFRRHGLEILTQESICGPTFALSLAAFLKVRPNSFLFALAVLLRPIQWASENISRRPSALRITARKH